jgi:hypothetical protein
MEDWKMRRKMLLAVVVVLSMTGFARAQVPHSRSAPNYIVPQSRAYSTYNEAVDAFSSRPVIKTRESMRKAREGRQGSISLRGDILMLVDGKSVLLTGRSTTK